MDKVFRLFFDIAFLAAVFYGLFYGVSGALNVAMFVVWAVMCPTFVGCVCFWGLVQPQNASGISPAYLYLFRATTRGIACALFAYHAFFTTAVVVALFILLCDLYRKKQLEFVKK